MTKFILVYLGGNMGADEVEHVTSIAARDRKIAEFKARNADDEEMLVINANDPNDWYSVLSWETVDEEGGPDE